MSPVVSIFYGLIVRMFFNEHNPPHIHVRYQTDNAEIDIKTAEILNGTLPLRQKRIIQAWVEIHREDLLTNWELLRNGEQPVRIEPLY